MPPEAPSIPKGTGQHPIVFVTISANAMAASREFYGKVFGWKLQAMMPELSVGMLASGPSVTLRSGQPEGFQGVIAFIGVPRVKAALEAIVAAGGEVEKAPWSIPVVGTLARFRDPSGTIHGLTEALPPAPMPHVPIPLGANPRAPESTFCSFEFHAGDGEAAGAFFGKVFGWGTAPTMPQYQGFDPGAGPGGVFQTHTPAIRALAYVQVKDVRATLDAIEAAGGKRTAEAMEAPGLATFGYFQDPSGTHMGLLS